MNAERSVSFETIDVGHQLPSLSVPLTTTLIVATAIASRDYQDVHHDPELARKRGAKDIFMNILSTNGFVGRYITDWAGPSARISGIAIKLGTQNYPGDTMVLKGEVTSKEDETRTVEVNVQGSNGLGDHVTGTVHVRLDTVETITATNETQKEGAR